MRLQIFFSYHWLSWITLANCLFSFLSRSFFRVIVRGASLGVLCRRCAACVCYLPREVA